MMTFPIQAYVQQLETSRLKLIQLEQELDRARQQVRRRLAFLQFITRFNRKEKNYNFSSCNL